MKIKIENIIIDVVSVSVKDNLLLIKTLDTIDHLPVLSILHTQDTILHMDDDNNVIQKFEGKFVLDSAEIRNGYVYYRIHLPSADEKEYKALQDAITTLELALCEIYESMEV